MWNPKGDWKSNKKELRSMVLHRRSFLHIAHFTCPKNVLLIPSAKPKEMKAWSDCMKGREAFGLSRWVTKEFEPTSKAPVPMDIANMTVEKNRKNYVSRTLPYIWKSNYNLQVASIAKFVV